VRFGISGHLAIAAIGLMAISTHAASWNYVILDTDCAAQGVYNGQIVGSTRVDSRGNPTATTHACMWTGTSASFLDLNPCGSTYSNAWGVFNGQQVGCVEYGGTLYACVWNGAPASCANLNPNCVFSSVAFTACNGQQVGISLNPGAQHACLWNNSSASFVDLNPSGATMSEAYGVCNGQQVGMSLSAGGQHACLWHGSSSSVVDLSPLSSDAAAWALFNGQQVGYELVPTGWHAALWTGTSSSFVDLNPSGATSSHAQSVFNGRQVGYASIEGNNHACLWNGTSAGFTDLHAVLQPGYSSSQANGVYVNNSQTWVVGEAINSTSGLPDAILWISSMGVSGNVTLQGYIGSPAGIPVTIEIRDSAGTVLEIHPISLAYGSNFNFAVFNPLLTGNYSAVAKAPCWLAKSMPLTLDSNQNGSVNFILPAGDVNGDNFVEDQDYSLMGLNWYQSGDDF